MATNVYLFNAQTTQSTGFCGPGLAAGVDDARGPGAGQPGVRGTGEHLGRG